MMGRSFRSTHLLWRNNMNEILKNKIYSSRTCSFREDGDLSLLYFDSPHLDLIVTCVNKSFLEDEDISKSTFLYSLTARNYNKDKQHMISVHGKKQMNLLSSILFLLLQLYNPDKVLNISRNWNNSESKSDYEYIEKMKVGDFDVELLISSNNHCFVEEIKENDISIIKHVSVYKKDETMKIEDFTSARVKIDYDPIEKFKSFENGFTHISYNVDDSWSGNKQINVCYFDENKKEKHKVIDTKDLDKMQIYSLLGEGDTYSIDDDEIKWLRKLRYDLFDDMSAYNDNLYYYEAKGKRGSKYIIFELSEEYIKKLNPQKINPVE